MAYDGRELDSREELESFIRSNIGTVASGFVKSCSFAYHDESRMDVGVMDCNGVRLAYVQWRDDRYYDMDEKIRECVDMMKRYGLEVEEE